MRNNGVALLRALGMEAMVESGDDMLASNESGLDSGEVRK